MKNVDPATILKFKHDRVKLLELDYRAAKNSLASNGYRHAQFGTCGIYLLLDLQSVLVVGQWYFLLMGFEAVLVAGQWYFLLLDLQPVLVDGQFNETWTT